MDGLGSFGVLATGTMALLLGGFMLFFPDAAERMGKEVPGARTGGPLRVPFGVIAFIVGLLAVLIASYQLFTR